MRFKGEMKRIAFVGNTLEYRESFARSVKIAVAESKRENRRTSQGSQNQHPFTEANAGVTRQCRNRFREFSSLLLRPLMPPKRLIDNFLIS